MPSLDNNDIIAYSLLSLLNTTATYDRSLKSAAGLTLIVFDVPSSETIELSTVPI